jgi:hypothetical protein
MDILDVVKSNEIAMINRLKEYETLDYRNNNPKEKVEREKRIATEFLRSILFRKHELLNERKKGTVKYPILFHD